MGKYIAIMKRPLNCLTDTQQGKLWAAATYETAPKFYMEVKFFTHGYEVYTFRPKHLIGISSQRMVGGKWEKVQDSIVRAAGGVGNYLALMGAVEKDFVGQPKEIK